jgi:hypothetical protein
LGFWYSILVLDFNIYYSVLSVISVAKNNFFLRSLR